MDKINTFKSENTQSQKSLWSVASGFYAEEKKKSINHSDSIFYNYLYWKRGDR